MQSVWEIPALPFIFRPLDSPHNPGDIPDTMPFHLGVEGQTGRLSQLPTIRLGKILERAYSEGSMITGLIDGEGIGLQYAEDFLSYVATVVGSDRLDGLRILEVGCGTGYLLYRMHQLGASVHGIEPGPQAELGAERYGIPIDRGFFPAVDVGDGYDVVVMYCLLEHVSDPAGLLRDVARVVRPGGTVLVAVPDEEPYVRAGEVSLLFHEHYSYFSARTLEHTVRCAGSRTVSVTRSDFSNLLFAAYVPGDLDARPVDVQRDTELAVAFRDRAEKLVAAVWERIDAVRASGGTIGLFVPSRAANILALRDEAYDGIRFFDDNPALTGTYYPGLPIPVEARDGLIASPPSCVLIMSLSFGDRIAASIGPQLGADVEIALLSDSL
jgi:2-polyprenyl-3-methyl-5-hydroxy-6-metoxy-1,4-benzoquinol methylase